MKLWIGGNVESDIYDDFFQIRKDLEKNINEKILSEEFGDSSVEIWDVIVKIFKTEESLSKVRFKSKEKTIDSIVVLDYFNFRDSTSLVQKKKLLVHELINVLTLVSKNKKLSQFDFEKLKKIIEEIH